MAAIRELSLATGDPTYPVVTARIALDPLRFGIPEDRGPWREVLYRILAPDGTAEARGALFCDALRGLAQPSGSPGSYNLVFLLPHRYPGNERLVCVSASGELKGTNQPGSRLMESTMADIRARYAVPEYPLAAEDDPQGYNSLPGGPWPFLTVNVSRSFVTKTLPLSSVKHPTDPDKALTRSFQKKIPMVTYRIRYENMGILLSEDLTNSLNGRVNQDPIFGKDAETLLFEAPESERAIGSAGDRQSRVEFLLTWYPPGWNTEIFEGDSTFSPVVFQDDTKPYETANFTPLILVVP